MAGTRSARSLDRIEGKRAHGDLAASGWEPLAGHVLADRVSDLIRQTLERAVNHGDCDVLGVRREETVELAQDILGGNMVGK